MPLAEKKVAIPIHRDGKKTKSGNGKIGINGIFKVARLFERAMLALVLLYRRVRYGYAFRRIWFSGPRYAKVDPEDYEREKGVRSEWRSVKRHG